MIQLQCLHVYNNEKLMTLPEISKVNLMMRNNVAYVIAWNGLKHYWIIDFEGKTLLATCT